MRKRLNGYFTVEAALIMPMVILFLSTMLFLGFYVYDRCFLGHCAYEAAVRGSSSLCRTNEEAYEVTLQAVERLPAKRVFATNELKYTIEVTGTTVEVIYECDVNVPFLEWLSQYTDDVDFHIRVKGSAPRGRQVKLIRAMDRISQPSEGASTEEASTEEQTQ